MRNRRLTLALVLVFASIGVGAAVVSHDPGADMTKAAQKLLKGLDDEQRKTATMPYDDAQRVAWHFIPKAERKGLQVKFMNDAQRKDAHALLRAALSQAGYDKTTKIMAIEQLLHDLEAAKGGGQFARDPQRYYFTVFGQPDEKGTWGLSVEGHHASLNFVVTAGKVVSSTPAMFGANPAEVTKDNGEFKQGHRILRDEEELGFKILHMLSDDQMKVAKIADKAPAEMRSAGEAQPPADAPAGLAAAKMTDDQRAALRALLKVYTDTQPESLAAKRWAEIDLAGFDKVHFAWAGADKPGVGHYYRVQGPTFLVEFVNVQPDTLGNRANHIHCMWRDMRGDFAIKR